MVKNFRIRGWFRRAGERQRFTLEIPALTPDHALERVYSILGSKHKVKRGLIRIEETMEVEPGGEG